MATQWPRVAARLAALLPTLPHWGGVDVKYGAIYDTSKATFATVGHSTDGTTTQAGSYTKTLALDGFQYAEQGSVDCQLTTTDDGPDLAAIRDFVFALMDDIEDAIRADRRLGVLSPEGTADLRVDVNSTQAIPGAALTVAFSIDYYTVT
jgi:hypothetical protein